VIVVYCCCSVEENLWPPGSPIAKPATSANGFNCLYKLTQTPPLPTPTSLPLPPVEYYQLGQRGAPLRAAASQQIPILPPTAIVQARNLNQVQRRDPNQPHHGLNPLPMIDPHHGQHESFPSCRYSLEPPPPLPGPLPASIPRLAIPAPQQAGGLPPFAQFVHTLHNPMRPRNF